MKVRTDAKRVYRSVGYAGDLSADVQRRERPAVVGRVGWVRRVAIAAAVVFCGGVMLVVLEGEEPVGEGRLVQAESAGEGEVAAGRPTIVGVVGGLDVDVARRPRFEVPELRRSAAWGVPRRGASGLFSVPRYSKSKETQDEHSEELDGGDGSGGGAGVESVDDESGTRSA